MYNWSIFKYISKSSAQWSNLKLQRCFKWYSPRFYYKSSLFFLIFINEMPEGMQSNVNIFSDDTSILFVNLLNQSLCNTKQGSEYLIYLGR